MAKKNFIAGAIKHPGALTLKARRAGKTVAGYCAGLGKGASTVSKQQCNLAVTLRRLRKKT